MEDPSTPIPLGPVVAKRTFAAFRADGAEVFLTVRLGVPFQDSIGEYRCPVQVCGLGDERVKTAFGEDPFVALQYALDLAGQLLDRLVSREQLEIRHRPEQRERERTSWIWRYPPHERR